MTLTPPDAGLVVGSVVLEQHVKLDLGLPRPRPDAGVIVAEGYYRLKAENEKLIKLVDDLQRLVISHHSSRIMREDLTNCPECSAGTGQRILDRAWNVTHPQQS